jgi:hypothetical protein
MVARSFFDVVYDFAIVFGITLRVDDDFHAVIGQPKGQFTVSGGAREGMNPTQIDIVFVALVNNPNPVRFPPFSLGCF